MLTYVYVKTHDNKIAKFEVELSDVDQYKVILEDATKAITQETGKPPVTVLMRIK